MKRLTRGWVQKAEVDYRVARQLSRNVRPAHDVVCFPRQQAAEKYFKGLLEEQGLPVPRTHDLDRLLTLLLPAYPRLRSHRRGLQFLTRFAVPVRYPGDNATKRQAASALRWAGQVREACRTLLGLLPPRGRRKRP
jgi:HEPN domain-containing protein